MNRKQTFEDYKEIEGEIWRQVPDFEKYEVSNFGRIRVGQYVIVPLDNKGYLTVRLNNGPKKGATIPVHRIVAMTFIPNPENKPEVDHIDTNRGNNHVDNLRWCWNLENFFGNETTLSKMSDGFKKETVYSSIRRDLYYQEKNGAKIRYDEEAKKTAEGYIDGSVEKLVETLTPWKCGVKKKKKNIKKIENELAEREAAIKKKEEELLNREKALQQKEDLRKNRMAILFNISNITIGTRVVVGKRIGMVKSISSYTQDIVVDLDNGEIITIGLERLSPILVLD